MSLNQHDLKYCVDHIFEVDSYQSKMGTDDKIVVLSFRVKPMQAAEDLVNFIEKGYEFVLDADKTSGEQSDGYYRVFVEMERSRHVSQEITEILDGIKKLADVNEFKFRYYKNFRSQPADQATLETIVPKDGNEYSIRKNETAMENYKNFFANSYVDEVIMEDNHIVFSKKYAEPLRFRFVDQGITVTKLREITESYSFNSFPEVLYLTKYIGDYNISIYGNKYIFENDNKCVILEK
jgi:hypothetical protein